MADSVSTKTIPMIHSLPEFTSDVYANINPSELVVFAVYTLQNDGHYSAIEEIVSACFRLFPHRFSLKNYFYWPDSALTTSYLNEAKRKGDLKGDLADGFAVKVQGRQTVKRVAKILGVTLPVPEKKAKKPIPPAEIKSVEPAKPAELKAEAVQEIKSIQHVSSEKLAKKKAVTAHEKSSAKKAPVKKQTTASKEKKSVAPIKVSAKKKAVTASTDKKSAIVPAVKETPAKKKTIAQPKKKTLAKKQFSTPKKKVSAKQTKPVKKTSVKQAAPVKTKSLPKQAPMKQEPLLHIKAEEAKKKETPKLVAVLPIKKMPAPKKETPQKQVPVKSAQPAQLTMALPIVEEKKTKPTPSVVQKVEPKPVKVEKVIAPAVILQVSKEEKAKAGKVVQVMERSDAYRQYRKNGDRSKISEFDFRSLLLCTMESSPETLARNVNTFKSYANIQNRQDLVTFLNFVENSFSTLLNSSGKKLAKKK